MYLGVDIVSWITLAVLVIFAFDGMRKGMIRTVFSMLTIIVAIAISSFISPYVSEAIENTAVYDMISQRVEDSIFEKESIEEEIDYDDAGYQMSVIEKLPLPDAVKESLMTHNNIEGYESLGVNAFRNYILKSMTGIIINAIAFVIILVLTGIILNIIASVLDLISYLPVLHTLNRLGGFAVGLINGVVILWIIGLAATVFISTQWGSYIYSQINESMLMGWINNNNLLLRAVDYIKYML